MLIALAVAFGLTARADTPPTPNAKVHDGYGAAITSTAGSGKTSLDVFVQGGISLSGASITIGGISVSASVLPTNAAQETGGNLASIATKINGTLTVQGGVSLTSTSGLALDASVLETHGSANGGSQAAKSDLIAAIFNNTPLALSNGQQASLQLTSTGLLKIDGSSSSPIPVTGGGNFTVIQPLGSLLHTNVDSLPALASGGNTIGSVNQAGSPWGVNLTQILGGAPSATNFVPSRLSDGTVYIDPRQIRTLSSGTDSITVAGSITATNPSVSPTGTAVPAQATMVGGSDGTNLKAIKVSTTGVVSVDNSANTQPISAVSLPLPTGASTSAKQPAPGTAGSASADVITVQGIASMTPLKTDGSATTQPVTGTGNFTVVQGTGTNLHTVVDSGTVAGTGNFTVVQPTGTNLHAVIDSGTVTANAGAGNFTVTQATGTNLHSVVDSGTVTANAGTGNFTVTQATGTNLHSVIDSQPTDNDTTATGNLTTPCVTPASCSAGSTVTATVNGTSSAVVELQNAFVGSIIMEASNDGGANWNQRSVYIGGVATTSAITTAGYYRVTGTGAYKMLRARATAWTSGTGAVTLVASGAPDIAGVINLNAANLLTQGWNFDGFGTAITSTAGTAHTGLDISNAFVEGSATGGTAAVKSILSGGVFNTVAPTLTNGQQGGVQLDSSGNLKINIASGSVTATNPSVGLTGSSTPTSATLMGGTDTTNLRPLNLDAQGNLLVNTSGVLIFSGSASALNGDAVASTDVSRYSRIYLQLSGAFTATTTFQCSNDNFTTTFSCTGVSTANASTLPVQTAAATGIWMIPVQSQYFRAHVTAFTSGTVVGTAVATNGSTPPLWETNVAVVGTPNVAVTSLLNTPPSTVVDVASAAHAVTFTSATLNPANGNGHVYELNVTAASGTNPTLDCSVQESFDTGTTFYRTYDFERLTTTGQLYSEQIRQTGNRINYVCTIGGTTPSFTLAFNRLSTQGTPKIVRRFFDRTIAPNSLNSTTASFNIGECFGLTYGVSVGATTTPATFDIQLSEDGATWVSQGNTIIPAANTALNAMIPGNMDRFARLIVTNAGTGQTLNYAWLKCAGY